MPVCRHFCCICDIKRMAPGGVEPPHADSKLAPAISVDLGRSGISPLNAISGASKAVRSRPVSVGHVAPALPHCPGLPVVLSGRGWNRTTKRRQSGVAVKTISSCSVHRSGPLPQRAEESALSGANKVIENPVTGTRVVSARRQKTRTGGSSNARAVSSVRPGGPGLARSVSGRSRTGRRRQRHRRSRRSAQRDPG